MTDDYDPAEDARRSYEAAVEAKRLRGDTHWPERAAWQTQVLWGRRAEIRERILACVEITNAGYETPCWIWKLADSGAGRGGGYPRMKLNSRTCAAHKVSFVNEHGYVPGNKQIDHKCRNRRCVNPDHLEMVSHIENQKRRDRALREARQ